MKALLMLRRGARLACAVALALCLAAAGQAAATDPPTGVVNINTATSGELERLPGIGASKARAIIDTRAARGSFREVDDLLAVKGIGEAALERLRPHVVLEGATTLGD